jgi:hypothetical protein
MEGIGARSRRSSERNDRAGRPPKPHRSMIRLRPPQHKEARPTHFRRWPTALADLGRPPQPRRSAGSILTAAGRKAKRPYRGDWLGRYCWGRNVAGRRRLDNPAQAGWLQRHGLYFLLRVKCGLLLLQIHDQALDLIHRDIVCNAPLYPAIPFDCLVNLDALFAHARLCRRGCQTTCDLQRYRYLVGASRCFPYRSPRLKPIPSLKNIAAKLADRGLFTVEHGDCHAGADPIVVDHTIGDQIPDL